MLTNERTVTVLGTEIQVLFRKEAEDEKLEELGGYYDSTVQRIVVRIPEEDKLSVEKLEAVQKKTLRHEILHAFLHESGLDYSSCQPEAWATNEEMIDWFAIQEPKIFDVYQQQGLLD